MAVLEEWRTALERAHQAPMNFYTAGVALLWTTAMRLGAPLRARPGTEQDAPPEADPAAPEGSQSGTARADGCNQPPMLSRHLIKVQLR
ncbi:MAG TPA: hypothetical protein VFO44_02085 [Steroidobacteraceae bacterium]|nr:hypothetical protein [Steroidobacteraceae bacterium]